MWLPPWLASLQSALSRRRPAPLRRRTSTRLIVEALEDRTVPSFLAPVSTPVDHDAVGDFDNDGRADLVATDTANNRVSVRLANEEGKFELETVQYSDTGDGPRNAVVGDFDNDGKLDIATENALSLSVLLGNGDGTFRHETFGSQFYSLISSGSGSSLSYMPQDLAAGDLNNDGKLDLVVAEHRNQSIARLGRVAANGYVRVWLGGGDGSFSPQAVHQLASPPRGSYYEPRVYLGDFNGDGKPDVLAADPGSTRQYAHVLRGNGDGTLQAPVAVKVYGGPLAVADLNGDGKSDVVRANTSSNSVSVFLSTGKVNTPFETARNFSVGVSPVSVAVGDFNRDGKADIVTANQASANVSVLLGTGDPARPYRAAQDFKAGKGATPQTVRLGDFNKDGWLDLVILANNSSQTSVLFNDQRW